jgi:hypothetical protein
MAGNQAHQNISPNLPEGLRRSMEKFQVRRSAKNFHFILLIFENLLAGTKQYSDPLERFVEKKKIIMIK